MPTTGTARATTIDDDAFSAFLQQSQPAVRAFVRRLCGGAHDVDDIVQETFAKVWRLRRGFDPARNGLAWLRQAAFRSFCDHRERARRTPEPRPDVHGEASPERPCASELRDELQHRLGALPTIERELLLGFHRDGLSLRELATRHALPVNTVKSHLHRARRRMQRSPS